MDLAICAYPESRFDFYQMFFCQYKDIDVHIWSFTYR